MEDKTIEVERTFAALAQVKIDFYKSILALYTGLELSQVVNRPFDHAFVEKTELEGLSGFDMVGWINGIDGTANPALHGYPKRYSRYRVRFIERPRIPDGWYHLTGQTWFTTVREERMGLSAKAYRNSLNPDLVASVKFTVNDLGKWDVSGFGLAAQVETLDEAYNLAADKLDRAIAIYKDGRSLLFEGDGNETL